MSYFDDYRARLTSSGNSESDANNNATLDIVDKRFENSPTHRMLPIDGITTSCRVINTDTFKTKDLLFKSSQRVNLGALVELDSNYYLVTDFIYDSVIAKARLTISSDVIKWIDSDGLVKEYHIVGDSISRFNAIDKNNNIMLRNEGLIFVQRNIDTDSIQSTQRFLIGGKPYSVVGIDNITNVDSNSNGLTIISITITTFDPKDDRVNMIADNSFLYAKDQTNVETGGQGGSLW